MILIGLIGRQANRAVTGITLAAFVAGCTAQLNPLTGTELQQIAQDRKARLISAEQEPLEGRLGLHEAMARAIKYNLDHQIEISNVQVTRATKSLTEMDMLPELVASADSNRRNNEPGGRSVTLGTGVTSATASRSTEQNAVNGDLSLSWDILDFGLSYVRAKQAANDVLIAQEQRRAIVNRLMENTRTAYWRAVSHERLSGRIATVIGRAERALSRSRSLANGGFEDRTTGLIYQRDMLRVIGEMRALERDLSTAKPQLAALVNLRPGAHFHVRVPPRKTLPRVSASTGHLIDQALVNRPELREITYDGRNVALENEAAALSLLPSISPYVSANVDGNDLLANGTWVITGTQLSWDLMGLFRFPRRQALIANRKALNDARALALTHTVATQVHVAKTRYDLLRSETRIAARYADVSQKVAQAIKAESASGLVGLQEEVFEEVGAILAELRFDVRYAELQSAYAAVFSAIGANNYPGHLTGQESVEVLENAIHDMWKARGEGIH